MRLFITGAAGFIGSNFIRYVLDNSDDEITVYDTLTYAGTRTNFSEIESSPRFNFIHGNICDRSTVASSMRDHDAVIHFAAESHVDRSIVDPDAFIRTNCDGTNVLCNIAHETGVEKFVHISTDEVYGSIDEGSFRETDALAPRSPYSASKAGSDLIALSHHVTHDLPVIVTRSSNNYGPRQFPEKMIPLFTTNLLDGLNVPIYGDGENVRDWCHVFDNCAAVDLVLRKGEIGEIYNIGAGNEITNIELTHALLSLTDNDESKISWVEDRLGHDRRYSIDTEKIRKLGWEPKVLLSDGLAKTVNWYKNNRSWWEPLKANL